MFERQFVGEDKIETITMGAMIARIRDYYKSTDAVIDEMKKHPGQWRIRTPFAFFRYIEE